MNSSGSLSCDQRSKMVERNDSLFRSAAVDMLAEEGWNALSTRGLSSRCGLTTGALYARFENMDQLLGELWVSELSAALMGPIDAAIDAVRSGDEEGFVAAFGSLVHPGPEVLAATELVLAAMVEPEVEPLVVPGFRVFLAERTRPSAVVSEVDATVAATICFLGLGLAHLAKRSWTATFDMTSELERYFAALRQPGPAVSTPRDEIAEYLSVYPFDTGDERLDRVLQATAIVIGEQGYRRATVQRICRTAGVSTGFLMSRFGTKLDLFATITEMMWGRGMVQIAGFLAEASEPLGPAMAEALAWREMQNPVIAKVAVLALETGRMAGFLPKIAGLVESQEVGFFAGLAKGAPSGYLLSELALGSGLNLVAWFSPSVRDLPYPCVTVPLVASAPPRYLPDTPS